MEMTGRQMKNTRNLRNQCEVKYSKISSMVDSNPQIRLLGQEHLSNILAIENLQNSAECYEHR